MCDLAQAFNKQNKSHVLLRSNKHPYAPEAHVKQPLWASRLCPSFLHTDLVSTFSFFGFILWCVTIFLWTTFPFLPCLLAKLVHSRRQKWEKHLGWSFWLFLSQLCLRQQLALSLTSLGNGFLLLHLLSCLLSWFLLFDSSSQCGHHFAQNLMCCLIT